eukprot:3063654-Rhodomonas_salina.6
MSGSDLLIPAHERPVPCLVLSHAHTGLVCTCAHLLVLTVGSYWLPGVQSERATDFGWGVGRGVSEREEWETPGLSAMLLRAPYAMSGTDIP